MITATIILALLTLLVATEPDPHDACPPRLSTTDETGTALSPNTAR